MQVGTKVLSIGVDAGRNQGTLNITNIYKYFLYFPWCLVHSNKYFVFRVGQISLFEGPLASFGEGGKYIDLFVAALRNYGMLCIGLYRYKYILYIRVFVWVFACLFVSNKTLKRLNRPSPVYLVGPGKVYGR